MVVDRKRFHEVDYSQAVQQAASAGTSGMLEATVGAVGKIAKGSVTTGIAEGLEDVADVVKDTAKTVGKSGLSW